MAGTESLDWIQHDTTMFADDLLLQWEYSSISELERMISAIQHCFRILARLGLQVQHRKTQLPPCPKRLASTHGLHQGGPLPSDPTTGSEGSAPSHCPTTHLPGHRSLLQGCNHCHRRAPSSRRRGPKSAPSKSAALAYSSSAEASAALGGMCSKLGIIRTTSARPTTETCCTHHRCPCQASEGHS